MPERLDINLFNKIQKKITIFTMKNNLVFEGVRDGFPIGLGYFTVAFSLGIIAKNAGLTPLQGFVASILNKASAGEFALYNAIQAQVSYLEVAVISLVVNARYLLMSCALSQRFNPKTAFVHRLGVAFGLTDEIFGIMIARKGDIEPLYNYAAVFVAALLWSSGTACGIIAGTFLPANIVSALSVALYGMFLAIIIPPAKKNRTIMICVIASFASSYLFKILPLVSNLSSGNKTIILTIVISSLAAIFKPIETNRESNSSDSSEKCEISANSSTNGEKNA